MQIIESKEIVCKHKKRVELPQDWFGTPNMAAVSLFWNTNMAAVTSFENALQRYAFCFGVMKTIFYKQSQTT